MANFLKNKKRMGIILTVVFALITMTAVFAAALMGPQAAQEPSSSAVSQEDPGEDEEDPLQEGVGGGEELVGRDEETQELPVSFNRPAEMRAVMLVPGNDFIKDGDFTDSKVKADIDAAIASAKSLTMNTILIDSVYSDQVLYQVSGVSSVPCGFDVMEYIVAKCREKGMYVYSTFDVLDVLDGQKVVTSQAVSSDVLDSIYARAKAFGEKYKVDGVMLDDYYMEQNDQSYRAYLSAGGGMGYENYLSDSVRSAVGAVASGIRAGNRGIQVGLLSTAVWANQSENEQGSATSASFQALYDGFADTKGFIEADMVDFVTVKAFGATSSQTVPFGTVAAWWSDLASRNGIPLYLMHASSKSVSTEAGWGSPEELTEQVRAAQELTGFFGSVFDSLGRLAADPQSATTTLIKYYNDELNMEYFLTQLSITKPEKTEFITNEPSVTFAGASDPNFDALLNGEKLERDSNGFFSITVDLEDGKNVFTFKHKTQTETYTITRDLNILKDVEPQGNISVVGQSDITITAMAYEGADVYAMVNGTKVPMSITTEDDDKTDKDSNFKKFAGTYTAPAATTSEQKLGNVVVYASWQGFSKNLQGAYVTVNKKAVLGDGVMVMVTAKSAETFPDSTSDDLSYPDYFPMCKGTLDITLGDEIVYKNGGSTYSYYNLQSGKRVYSKDITTVDSDDYSLGDNVIKGLTVTSDSNNTSVMLNMTEKAAYTVKYSFGEIAITFDYTKSVPDNLSLSKNPLFSSANWSGTTLKLKLKNSFLGFYAYYNNSGQLVFQFNNPPSSLGSARISLDPGHCNTDPGAIGFYKDPDTGKQINEYDINLAITKYVKEYLEDEGVDVYMVNTTSGYVSLESRMSQCKSLDSHLVLCIHANSAASSSASGTEAYYFNSYSSSLAKTVSSKVASALGTSNRGSKFGRFYMTRDSEFPAILLETGFVSNENEFSKLISNKYQKAVAKAIVNGAVAFLENSGMGNTATGTQSVGNSGGAVVAVTGVKLDKTTLALNSGDTYELKATVSPDNASNQNVSWKSSNTGVATVTSAGKITAKATGTATITATSDDGGKTATCKVTVTDNASVVTSVTLDVTELAMKVDEEYKLTATVGPEGAADKSVSWESSNESVATVTARGVVTARKAGTAKIAVTSNSNSNKYAICTVTVTETSTVAVTGITAQESGTIELAAGGKATLGYTISPSGATNQGVSWKSSDTGAATVSSSGVVTAQSVSSDKTVTITVTTKDGGYTATWTVLVKAPASSSEPSSSGSSSSASASEPVSEPSSESGSPAA
ncbi:MAG: N-acetylmuramoyl-L-alanine amidase [Oscillospiraceae bacterium]|nr:N-acetylmuramoyl-L-alanine amidase [Oscillospiraceae bacterium]